LARKKGTKRIFKVTPDGGSNQASKSTFTPTKERLFSEAPGIKVEETVYYRYPEYETFEETHDFEDEEQAMGYLVGEIAEKIAFYQHLNEQKR
jgi:hypothetical protein